MKLTAISSAGLLCCLLTVLAGGTFGQDVTSRSRQHHWEYIMYPHVQIPSKASASASFLLSFRKEVRGMQFQVTLWTTPANLPKKGELMVRLHRNSGEMISFEGSSAGAIGSGLGTSYYDLFHFPWGKNTLEEAWVAVHFPERTYWLEIPYGFTRNPASPPAPAAPELGVPRLSAAMKALGPKDQILPWLNVQYDLGEIQNKWRLSLKQSNRVRGETELILYREDQQVGKSIYVWEMCSPQTSIKIVRQDGSEVGSTLMSIRRHEDGHRRSDTFRISDPAEGRDWGRMIITVDERSYELTMPSSLFRYAHGAGEPHHARSYWPSKEY